MNVIIAIVAIAVTFSALRTLNREVRPGRRDIGPFCSAGIAVFVLACIHVGLYAKVTYLDPCGIHPIIHALLAIVFLLLVFQVATAVFRYLLRVASTDRDIHICFGGDIEEDRAFASELMTLLSRTAPASVCLFDIHQFERRQDAYQSSGAAGTFVYVISEQLVSDDEVRHKLLMTGQKADIPGYMYFYICRGTTYNLLKDAYPDIEQLGDRIMIGTESDATTMLEQASAYATNRPEMMRKLRRFVRCKYYLSSGGLIASALLPILYICTPFVWVLMLFAFFVPSIADRIPDATLAIGCSQYSALLLYRQRALDFWPFLGARLGCDPSTQVCRTAGTWKCPSLSFWNWVHDTQARRQAAERSKGVLDTDQSLQSVRAWSSLVLQSRLYTVLLLCGGGLAISLFAVQSPESLRWMVPGMTLGLIIPCWVAWSQRYVQRIAYWRLGLTRNEINRTKSYFEIEGRSGMFIGNLSYFSHNMHRSWLRQDARVFISYSWSADEERNVAITLHHTLTKLGIEHFYDKENIRSGFASWRSSVSDALMSCTHFILLLDDTMPADQVVDREISTAVQRLHTDVFPSFICVAEPQTVNSLLQKKDIPFEFRWLLEWSPCISLADAQIPRLLDGLIRQRVRQGRIQDFLTMLFPQVYLKTFSEQFVISTMEDNGK